MPAWLEKLLPILILLGAVGLVLARLPKVDLGHTAAFRRRRMWNWLPLGLTYAFLYMGRYNLTVSKTALGDLMTKQDFGFIFGAGTVTYGLSFIINGPLTDRLGGRLTILISALGSAVMNLCLGIYTWRVLGETPRASSIVPVFSLLYAGNMYFQSFGAVSIVKVNAGWFHVKERGVFGGIFGILISLGIYFAFDWGGLIVSHLPTYWVFLIPSVILVVFAALDYFLVFDQPSHAGLSDFDTQDASSGDEGPRLPAIDVFKMMWRNPVIMTIAGVEFCSGFLRNAIMQYGKIFGAETGLAKTFVFDNWGMMMCMAGILGGVVAGVISDRLFQSRRGPVATVLYGGMLLGSVVMFFALATPFVGWVVIAMTVFVVGVHGMLSGTASMDFGGQKNAGVAVGLIDGFVYLGTAFVAVLLGNILPSGDAAKDPGSWIGWPVAMLPLALVGLLLAARVWNATPQKKAAPASKTPASPVNARPRFRSEDDLWRS